MRLLKIIGVLFTVGVMSGCTQNVKVDALGEAEGAVLGQFQVLFNGNAPNLLSCELRFKTGTKEQTVEIDEDENMLVSLPKGLLSLTQIHCKNSHISKTLRLIPGDVTFHNMGDGKITYIGLIVLDIDEHHPVSETPLRVRVRGSTTNMFFVAKNWLNMNHPGEVRAPLVTSLTKIILKPHYLF